MSQTVLFAPFSRPLHTTQCGVSNLSSYATGSDDDDLLTERPIDLIPELVHQFVRERVEAKVHADHSSLQTWFHNAVQYRTSYAIFYRNYDNQPLSFTRLQELQSNVIQSTPKPSKRTLRSTQKAHLTGPRPGFKNVVLHAELFKHELDLVEAVIFAIDPQMNRRRGQKDWNERITELRDLLKVSVSHVIPVIHIVNCERFLGHRQVMNLTDDERRQHRMQILFYSLSNFVNDPDLNVVLLFHSRVAGIESWLERRVRSRVEFVYFFADWHTKGSDLSNPTQLSNFPQELSSYIREKGNEIIVQRTGPGKSQANEELNIDHWEKALNVFEDGLKKYFEEHTGLVETIMKLGGPKDACKVIKMLAQGIDLINIPSPIYYRLRKEEAIEYGEVDMEQFGSSECLMDLPSRSVQEKLKAISETLVYPEARSLPVSFDDFLKPCSLYAFLDKPPREEPRTPPGLMVRPRRRNHRKRFEPEEPHQSTREGVSRGRRKSLCDFDDDDEIILDLSLQPRVKRASMGPCSRRASELTAEDEDLDSPPKKEDNANSSWHHFWEKFRPISSADRHRPAVRISHETLPWHLQEMALGRIHRDLLTRFGFLTSMGVSHRSLDDGLPGRSLYSLFVPSSARPTEAMTGMRYLWSLYELLNGPVYSGLPILKRGYSLSLRSYADHLRWFKKTQSDNPSTVERDLASSLARRQSALQNLRIGGRLALDAFHLTLTTPMVTFPAKTRPQERPQSRTGLILSHEIEI